MAECGEHDNDDAGHFLDTLTCLIEAVSVRSRASLSMKLACASNSRLLTRSPVPAHCDNSANRLFETYLQSLYSERWSVWEVGFGQMSGRKGVRGMLRLLYLLRER